MYTGAYATRGRRRRRRHRRKLRIPVVLVEGLLLICCLFVLGKAVRAVGDLVESVQGLFATAAPTTPRDQTPPEIQGVQDKMVYIGETIAYRSGVWAEDDEDPEPVLEVDSSRVDLSKAGSYPVIYMATDGAGNTATATATVTVLEMKPGFVELETIYEAADKLLRELNIVGAPARQQVEAIYTWARTRISYGGHSDRYDYRQTAYTVMQGLQGDCFGYFAVTKLLFEQLGLPNLDVKKMKNHETDSEHFWSLVSVDGGGDYYHFDATPRVGEGDDFCLVTDEFLDAYSEEHNNCHNRDRTLYPATPKEALQ